MEAVIIFDGLNALDDDIIIFDLFLLVGPPLLGLGEPSTYDVKGAGLVVPKRRSVTVVSR